MNSSLSKTGQFVIKFAINYKTLRQLVGEEGDLRVQACFHIGNKPVMMTDHCESGDYIEGAKLNGVVRCLRWGTISVMCRNVWVEIATSGARLRCLCWCSEICNEEMMSVLLLKRVSKRPRNDEHIITPNHPFETLRTAYNSKNYAKLKGETNNQSGFLAKMRHTISP